MAIDINTVYQKVLTLSNKEQRGYITPQEFNLLADKAQNEIFQNYFYKIRTTEAKPKAQVDYADELEMIEEKLHPFHVDEFVYTGDSTLTLPTSAHKIISITRDGNQVTQINKHEVAYTQNNPLLKASLARSVFVREDSGKVTIYPSPSSSTYDTDTTTDGIVNQELFEVSYYKSPTAPSWGYIIVNEKALYNVNTTIDFELHSSEEESLVSRILILAGTAIKQPDIQQAGAQDMQLINQQQNS